MRLMLVFHRQQQRRRRYRYSSCASLATTVLCISTTSTTTTTSAAAAAAAFASTSSSNSKRFGLASAAAAASASASTISCPLWDRTCRLSTTRNRSSTFRSTRTAMFSSSTSSPAKDEEASSSSSSSKNSLRVALCQFHVTEDREQNHATCRQYLEQAAERGAQLVVLPEIWASPYATAAFPDYAQILPNKETDPTEDTSRPIKESSSADLLRQAAREFQYWIVGGSLAEQDGDKFYNTCLVFNPQGRIVAKHRKVHLFDIDVPGGVTFKESETLSPGDSPTHFDLSIPSLDLMVRIGIGICYDIRFAPYSMLLRHERDCKILIFPGAFNLTTGPAHWELLQRARAVDNQCFVLTASPARAVPTNDDKSSSKSKYPPYTAWGHSTAVSPWGTVIATTDEKPSLVMVDLDLDSIPGIRQSIPIAEQERHDIYKIVSTTKKD